MELTDTPDESVGKEPLGFDELFSSPHYERLRSRLVRIFARRGSRHPEELADETVSRVVAKLDEVAPSYRGEPARYVYAVARNVFREQLREPRLESLDDAGPRSLDALVGGRGGGRNETDHCLDACLDAMRPSDRRLVTEYYRYEGSRKIQHRKQMAEELGLGLGTIRLRVLRIRRRLGQCIGACREKS